MSQHTTYEIIVDYLGEKLEIRSADITDTSTFDSVGADSIFLVELALKLERSRSVAVPDGILHSEQTIGEAARAVDELAAVP